MEFGFVEMPTGHFFRRILGPYDLRDAPAVRGSRNSEATVLEEIAQSFVPELGIRSTLFDGVTGWYERGVGSTRSFGDVKMSKWDIRNVNVVGSHIL
ncbi:hypothetical protein KNO81_16750 [Paraburkholderia sediminicola]|nr:hypothetical protein [Paraburkholderia sediminicola]